MVLKITVKTLDSQNYQFEASDEWTVKQFKEHIEPTTQVPYIEQRLIFCGRVLQDDKKLTEYDCNGKVIHLVRRPPPSSDAPSSSTADSNNNNSNFPGNGNENNRFLDESNVLFSAMTLSPENVNMNHILRHMLSLQQAIIGRSDGTTAVSTMEPASMTDMERHLHNATRLLRITVNTVNECMVRIAALPPVAGPRTTFDQAQSSVSSLRTIITTASSHTDLQRNDIMQTDEATNQEATSRGNTLETTVDDIGVGSPAGRTSSNSLRAQRPYEMRQSLTTDDLPPVNVSPTPRVIPLLRTQTENQYQNVPNAQQRGEADLDRYLSILNYSCDLQNQFQGLLRRYRQLTDMSRRGGLIVSQQASTSATASYAANSSSSSSQEPNSEASASTSNESETRSRSINDSGQGQRPSRGLTSTLMEEAKILGAYVPRIMHHISHLQHALSDFSVDFAHGRLDEVEGRRRQTARRSSRPRYATPRDLSGNRTSARHSTTSNRAQSASRATASRDTASFGRGPSIEGSVTITATTVDATPVVTTSTSGSNVVQNNTTFVVTAEPRQAGIRIPVPIPLPIGSHGSITMDFTPIVSGRSRTQSLRESEGRGIESGAGIQTEESNRQSGTNQPQQSNTTRSQQSTTSNSTQTANRSFGVISGRIPIPFDYFLPCFSPWATYSVANRAVRPNEVQPSRITVRTPHTHNAARETATNITPSPGASPQAPRNALVSDGGLSEVVSNIVGAFFRPQQGATQPETNQSSNSGQDPLLNMLPDIAINAATQFWGGVFGVPPTAGQQQGSTQHSTGSNVNNTSVMMDIDIDDSSSSQSESRYQDANDTQPTAPTTATAPNQPASMPSRPILARQSFWSSPSLVQPTPGHSQSSSSSHTTNQQPTSAVGSRYERRQLVEVMRNHPDWIPIIEADISVLEQSQESASNNRPFFSDAYLSSISRKRRRLLNAIPEHILILQPSPSQAISNLLRRSIMNLNSTGIERLEQVLGSISNDLELQAAYEEHIKSAVEVRLKSDYDYCPKKFEHSDKYFK